MNRQEHMNSVANCCILYEQKQGRREKKKKNKGNIFTGRSSGATTLLLRAMEKLAEIKRKSSPPEKWLEGRRWALNLFTRPTQPSPQSRQMDFPQLLD
uniref:Uncharacterized protein n=1 Tax=Ditylenchus dipsaci TaxID=166011 RepID=A0A915EFR7_9BILA